MQFVEGLLFLLGVGLCYAGARSCPPAGQFPRRIISVAPLLIGCLLIALRVGPSAAATLAIGGSLVIAMLGTGLEWLEGGAAAPARSRRTEPESLTSTLFPLAVVVLILSSASGAMGVTQVATLALIRLASLLAGRSFPSASESIVKGPALPYSQPRTPLVERLVSGAALIGGAVLCCAAAAGLMAARTSVSPSVFAAVALAPALAFVAIAPPARSKSLAQAEPINHAGAAFDCLVAGLVLALIGETIATTLLTYDLNVRTLNVTDFFGSAVQTASSATAAAATASATQPAYVHQLGVALATLRLPLPATVVHLVGGTLLITSICLSMISRGRWLPGRAEGYGLITIYALCLVVLIGSGS